MCWQCQMLIAWLRQMQCFGDAETTKHTWPVCSAALCVGASHGYMHQNADTGVQLLLVAHSRGKMRMTEVKLVTGDVIPPRFAQPPLVDTAETSMRLRVSTSEPATLHWAISYDNVAAEYRYQLLGFKTSQLSTQQVLAVSSTPAAEAARVSGDGSAAAARRQLHQGTVGNGTELREDGPIVAWGQWEVAGANEVTDLEITPPCISDTVMCAEHTDSLNPQTQYKVRICLGVLPSIP